MQCYKLYIVSNCTGWAKMIARLKVYYFAVVESKNLSIQS